MVNPEREPRRGLVEVDEIIIPFRPHNDPVVVPAGRSGVEVICRSPAWSKSMAARPGVPG
jgi:hypothetical protein